MTRKVVEFHPVAAAEAEAAVGWYRERSVRVAEAFLAEIERAAATIAESPERWPLFGAEARRYPLHRFPFWVIYRAKGEVIQVLAVAHARRKPGYWRPRSG